jgi:hypothetical protein
MRKRSLIFAALLAYAAFSLTRALVTTSGVGSLEYLVGALLLAMLVTLTVRAVRRGIPHG